MTGDGSASGGNDCFVIMPFSEQPSYATGHFKQIYDQIFRPAIMRAGFNPVRADDSKSADLIQANIIRGLVSAPIVLCDLSTRNPNVLFELGIRQAFDKPVVLVQEMDTPRIFDIAGIRCYDYVWSQVLYGISYGDGEIVSVALSQVGNVGGQPYWSWYGFDGRVEWCACFVSWCANECGYIEAGIIPKFAGCVLGSQWFKDRGQWQDGSFEPSAGHIIFFDWEGDGITDHVGIVERVENGTVYTIEGNSGDACKRRSYPIGSSVIYGYGIPAY